MPEIDEVILRDLMHRSVGDLHAPAGVTAGILTRNRRRHTRRLGVAAVGAAGALAAGTIVATGTSGASGPALRSGTAQSGAIHLTAAQHALFGLSQAAAATPQAAGRYAVQRDRQREWDKGGPAETDNTISVLDSVTGAGWTYQQHAPHQLHEASGTTQQQYAAIPTGTAALRAYLLAQAKQQVAQAEQQVREKNAASGYHGKVTQAQVAPGQTDDDFVFAQATTMLWSPLLSPALRSALYRVLAATPGVVVRTGVTDSSGRPAVRVSRYDSASAVNIEVFEDPSTGATLQAISAARTWYGSDLYLSTTRTSTIPPNPYRH